MTPRRPEVHRINRTGNFNFRPLSKELDVQDRTPEFDKEPEAPGQSSIVVPVPAYSLPRNWKQRPQWVLPVSIIGGLGLATAVVIGLVMNDHDDKQAKPPVVPMPILAEQREKLDADARETLIAILSNNDPEEIAAHVVGGEEMIPAIRERLEATPPFPRFSDGDVVSTTPMKERDLQRGFYGLHYQCAPADTFSLNRPLLPTEMQQGFEGLSLLEAGAVIDVVNAPPPRQALAFFNTQGDRFLLEWELFVQTWDRTLASFADGDLGEGPMRFRVILSLDRPVFENGEDMDDIILRVQDPLFLQDVLRIPTRSFDPAVIALKPTPAEAEADPSVAMRPRTATVDLLRNADSGVLSVDRLVCLEFLGLGGREEESKRNPHGKNPQ